jgi:uncharacterized damage-inducible protein DinB
MAPASARLDVVAASNCGARVPTTHDGSTGLVSVLVEQLDFAFFRDAWHGPAVMEALHSVDAAQAHAHPIQGAHGIWEIALHLASWKHEVCRRVEGAEPHTPLEGDWPEPPAPDDATWHATVDTLEHAHRRLIAATRLLQPDRLHDMVGAHRDRPLGTGVTFEAMLLGSVQHDVYHAGQIVMLRKALNAER